MLSCSLWYVLLFSDHRWQCFSTPRKRVSGNQQLVTEVALSYLLTDLYIFCFPSPQLQSSMGMVFFHMRDTAMVPLNGKLGLPSYSHITGWACQNKMTMLAGVVNSDHQGGYVVAVTQCREGPVFLELKIVSVPLRRASALIKVNKNCSKTT